MFNNSITTEKINKLMMFKEIIAVYSGDRKKQASKNCRFTDL
jgi:hypothetical protein